MKLAEAYNHGEGVNTNFELAFEYYQRAANKENIEAAFNLGKMYQAGIGVTENTKEAIKWYEKAATNGHLESQVNLGMIYIVGQQTLQDFERAHMWFNIAASRGNQKATTYRNRLTAKLPNETLLIAQKKARICLETNFVQCK